VQRIDQLLENNRRWSERITREDPDFFPTLARQQSPDLLWIGCSDSRVEASRIVGVAPGEIFVQRNVANIVSHTDMNCLSVVQFAVDVLRVEHIIVCGHYGCGGVKAALEVDRHGLVDNWLRIIRDTAFLYEAELRAMTDESAQVNRLCELNVERQLLNLCETTIVLDAWARGQKLMVHGWIYGLSDGIIRDLEITISDEAAARELGYRFRSADGKRGAGRPASDAA
jgi:carbonic anhydrase